MPGIIRISWEIKHAFDSVLAIVRTDQTEVSNRELANVLVCLYSKFQLICNCCNKTFTVFHLPLYTALYQQ